MCDVECKITYCLWPAHWGAEAIETRLTEIDYHLRVDASLADKALESEIMARGLAEIRMVEGANAAYEIVDVRSALVDMPLPWH